MRFWFDIINPPHVHFLSPFIKYYLQENRDNDGIITLKDFAETVKLAKTKNYEFSIFGKYNGKSKTTIIISKINRYLELLKKLDDFDVSMACGHEAPQLSWLKRRKSLFFTDNDISSSKLYNTFASYIFMPRAIDNKRLDEIGVDKNKVISYDGFKEDIYIAEYKPNKTFKSKIPFNNYIVLRPENIKANYVQESQNKSITPILMELLIKKGINIVFLPRYESDIEYAKNKKVYIPDEPLNGLDLCYNADAVLTGAGTFAREAACLGVPAVSFFTGKRLMTVDKKMIDNGLMFYSRHPHEIVNYFFSSNKNEPDLNRCKIVAHELREKVSQILSKMKNI